VLHQERLFCIAHYPSPAYWPTINASSLPSQCAVNQLDRQPFDSIRLGSPGPIAHAPIANTCSSPSSTIKCESTNALVPLPAGSAVNAPTNTHRPSSPTLSSLSSHHLSLAPHNQPPSTTVQLQQLQSPPIGLLGPKAEHPIGASLHLGPSPFQSLSGPVTSTAHAPLLSCYGGPSPYDSTDLMSNGALSIGCNASSIYASLYANISSSSSVAAAAAAAAVVNSNITSTLDMTNSGSRTDHGASSSSLRCGSPSNEMEMENGVAPITRKGRPRKRKQLSQMSNGNGSRSMLSRTRKTNPHFLPPPFSLTRSTGVSATDLESLSKALHEQNLNHLSGSVHLSSHVNDQVSMSGDSSLNGIGSMSAMSSNAQRTKRMRTSFKHHQLKSMKNYFQMNQNPDAKELKMLSAKTGLTKRVLQVWFQNARAKWRRSHLKGGGGGVGGCSVNGTMSGLNDNGLGDLQLNDSTGSGAALPNGGSSLSIAPSTPGSSTCLGSPASSGCARQFSTPSPTSTALMDSGNGTLLMTHSTSGSMAMQMPSHANASNNTEHTSYSPSSHVSSLMRPSSPGHMRPVGSVHVPVTSASCSTSGPLSFGQHPSASLHPLGLMANSPPSSNQLSPLSAGLLNPAHLNGAHMSAFVTESLVPTFRELY
jgi:hypothetical protein